MNSQDWVQKIQVSKIGLGQLKDVEHSGAELHDEYFRTCTVLQGDPPYSDIGDTVPHRIAKLYGGSWETWNRHFIAQVAGCPLRCWYCYVDNLKVDEEFSVEDLVNKFMDFRMQIPDLNVFHFMGGCPGRYSHLWKAIRSCMDSKGLHSCVFLTDVILVENTFWGKEPWKDIPERSMVSVCLKGTNFLNFVENTGVNAFGQALYELFHYFGNEQVYYALLNWDEKDVPYIENLLGYKVDWMKVKYYGVVEERLGDKERYELEKTT